MQNELTIFKHPKFGDVRGFMQDGKPWFVAFDIARALGYSNPQKAIRDHCKHAKSLNLNETFRLGICNSPNGCKIIPEGDLYRLIVSSKLPIAERFERWVFDEVLPALRKNGSYEQCKQQLTMPKNFPDALERYAAELRKNAALETELEDCKIRLGESEVYHKVSEDPWIRATFKSRSFGYIGRILKDISNKMGLPICDTPHPVVGKVNVYSKDAISAFRIMCENDTEYLANCRLD